MSGTTYQKEVPTIEDQLQTGGLLVSCSETHTRHILTPSTKGETPKTTALLLVCRSVIICSTPPVYAEDTKATAKVANATKSGIAHFFHWGKF